MNGRDVESTTRLAYRESPIVYVVRHGETPQYKAKQFRGFEDDSLDDVGRKQIEQARNDLQDVDFDAALSSDLRRTMETIEILLDGRPRPEIQRLVEMRPLNVGKFEGLPKTSHWMGVLKTYLDNPDTPIPGGASLNWFRSRYRAFFDRAIHLAMHANNPHLWVQHATTNHELGHILYDDIDALDVSPGGIIGIWTTPQGLYAKALAGAAVRGSGYAYS